MSRPLRIAEPGMWHHVTNRGQNRCLIFLDAEERERFLALVGECGPRWRVRLHAYCLMSTHYHLLVEDLEGRLSRAMRHVDGVYTQWFNRRHRRDGSLMRGRFRSRVVQREGYLVEVVRYIHTNPVRSGIVSRAGDYEWSSHRAYLGRLQRDWLSTDTVLKLMGLRSRGDELEFDEFVHRRVDADLAARLGTKRWSPILGDEAFAELCRGHVRDEPRLSGDEVPEGRRLAALTAEEVISVACEAFELTSEQIVGGKRGCRNVPRLVTILACRTLTPCTGRELGAVFGIHPGTVSTLARVAERMCAAGTEARGHLTRLERRLGRTILQRET